MLLMAQAPRSAQRTSGEEAVLEDVHDYYALCCKVVSAQTNILTDIALFGFPGGSDGKASACNVGDPGLSPGSEDPLEKEMATHSSTLAWRIPWTEEPGGLQFTGSQRVEHD